MRQKLASVLRGSPSLALSRMNGFSPVRITRLGSAMLIVPPVGEMPHLVEAGGEEGAQRLGVVARRQLGGPRQAGEEHGDGLPLVAGSHGPPMIAQMPPVVGRRRLRQLGDRG